MSEDKRKTQTIAIMSGKGGSGKTSIALSMSHVLHESGLKVLLIDCDLATNGATYFFEAEMDDDAPRWTQVSSDVTSANAIDIFATNSGFDFAASTGRPGIGRSGLTNEDLDACWEKICSRYDAVILDCQAGYSEITEWAAGASRRQLIVLEADAVSSSAFRNLALRMGEVLRANDTFQVFNKLTEDERSIYEKVAGGTLFRHLPPLPFDWQVRAAFAIREIPGIVGASSAFGLAVLRLMKPLFPAIAQQLDEFENAAVGTWHEDIAKSVAELEAKKREIGFEASEKRRATRILRLRMGLAVFLAMNVVMLMLYYGLDWTSVSDSGLADGRFRPLVIGLGGAVTFGGLVFFFNRIRDIEFEREAEVVREELNRLEAEAERYRTLVRTDPQLREYNRSTV